MMKIVTEEDTFIIPESNKLNIIVTNKHKDTLLDCFNSYFNLKKKTKCNVYDNFGQKINTDFARFIYVSKNSAVDSNFSFKPKTTFNTEMTNIIENNIDEFRSIEIVKNGLSDMRSDKGMIKITKVVTKGIDEFVSLQLRPIDFSLIIQNIEFDVEDLCEQEKIMMVYNLLLFIYKTDFLIIFIDFEVNEKVEKWLHNIELSNVIVLIDNDAIEGSLQYNDYGFISLSNFDHLEEYDSSVSSINKLNYLFHPIVKRNIDLQTEKNRDLLNIFRDDKTTFFIKADTVNYS